MGRNKKEEPVVHARVSQELKDWVEKRVKKLKKTESNFIREVLETLRDWEGGNRK